MMIIILAAGYAVRLQPLTLTMSKSLLEVGGRKIVDRIIDKIDGAGCSRSPLYVITNDKFFKSFDDWLKNSRYKSEISLINDGSTNNDNRLGAIKDLELTIANKNIADDLLVIAGDNLFEFELHRFLEFAKKHSDGVSVALYDIGDLKLARNFGVVKIGGDNRVTEFQEKPEKPESTLISTGIYYFPKNKLSFIKEYVKMRESLDPSAGSGSTPSRSRGVDAPGYYISWLSGMDKVYGFAFSEDWYDIGTIESYKKADVEYSKKEKK